MRKVLSICFLMLYGVAMLKPIHPFIDYYLRYELYAGKLCINLDRPEMKCNGQCILMQKLKKVNEENFPQLPSANLVNLKDYPIGLLNDFVLETSQTPIQEFYNSWYGLHLVPGHSFDVFRPPTFLRSLIVT